jgi:hypothetical protein
MELFSQLDKTLVGNELQCIVDIIRGNLFYNNICLKSLTIGKKSFFTANYKLVLENMEFKTFIAKIIIEVLYS